MIRTKRWLFVICDCVFFSSVLVYQTREPLCYRRSDHHCVWLEHFILAESSQVFITSWRDTPRSTLFFFDTFSMCPMKFSLFSRVIPRYLTSLEYSIWTPHPLWIAFQPVNFVPFWKWYKSCFCWVDPVLLHLLCDIFRAFWARLNITCKYLPVILWIRCIANDFTEFCPSFPLSLPQSYILFSYGSIVYFLFPLSRALGLFENVTALNVLNSLCHHAYLTACNLPTIFRYFDRIVRFEENNKVSFEKLFCL